MGTFAAVIWLRSRRWSGSALVVLVVVTEGARDRVAALGQLLPGILEHVELELGTGLEGETLFGGAGDLALEDRPRRDRDLVAGLVVDGVGEDHRGAGQPGQDAQLVPDRLGDPVAVARLPVHELEALGRVHLHVRAQEVRAEVGAVGDHAVEERLTLDALAHEPALHVRDGHHDGVDLAVANHLFELDETGMLRVVVVAHGSLRPWRPRPCRAACWRMVRRRRSPPFATWRSSHRPRRPPNRS
jgi:hypothetical protein